MTILDLPEIAAVMRYRDVATDGKTPTVFDDHRAIALTANSHRGAAVLKIDARARPSDAQLTRPRDSRSGSVDRIGPKLKLIADDDLAIGPHHRRQGSAVENLEAALTPTTNRDANQVRPRSPRAPESCTADTDALDAVVLGAKDEIEVVAVDTCPVLDDQLADSHITNRQIRKRPGRIGQRQRAGDEHVAVTSHLLTDHDRKTFSPCAARHFEHADATPADYQVVDSGERSTVAAHEHRAFGTHRMKRIRCRHAETASGNEELVQRCGRATSDDDVAKARLEVVLTSADDDGPVVGPARTGAGNLYRARRLIENVDDVSGA